MGNDIHAGDDAGAGAERDETLYIIQGILYKSTGVPIMPNAEEDRPYRLAYRRLFQRMRRWPPDGIYAFDGEEMTLVRIVPWSQVLSGMAVM